MLTLIALNVKALVRTCTTTITGQSVIYAVGTMPVGGSLKNITAKTTKNGAAAPVVEK
jgi:hypothetical protein